MLHQLFDPFRFANPADERAFAEANAARFGRYPPILAAIGIAAFLAYLPFDSLSTRQSELSTCRMFIVAIFAAILVASTLARGLRRHWPWLLQLSFQVGLIGTLLLNALLEGTSPYGISSTSFALNMIVLLVTGTLVAPMSFGHALLSSTSCAVAYAAGVAKLSVLTPTDVFGNSFNVAFVAGCCLAAAGYRERLLRRLFVEQAGLSNERNLLSVILSEIVPTAVAVSIRQGQKVPPRAFGEVSILFADLVGFTRLSTRIGPKHLVEILDDLFTRFDDIVERHHLEKVKTIGDAYMVVGGAREEREDVVLDTVRLAFEMIEETRRLGSERSLTLELRVGIHVGSVIGGVIGRTRMAFDYWGDAVNLASRLESSGIAGKVQVSETVVLRLGDRVDVEQQRTVELKGKGDIVAFVLKPPAAPAQAGPPAH